MNMLFSNVLLLLLRKVYRVRHNFIYLGAAQGWIWGQSFRQDAILSSGQHVLCAGNIIFESHRHMSLASFHRQTKKEFHLTPK